MPSPVDERIHARLFRRVLLKLGRNSPGELVTLRGKQKRRVEN
jgi:hypothetical protein